MNDLTDKVFTNWKVLYRDLNNENKKECYWICKCLLCNNLFSIRGSALTSGKSRSCKSCSEIKDLTNKKFGEWIVIENKPDKCLCKCSCGTERYVKRGNLTNGISTNCGCIRNKNKKENAISQMLNQKFGMLTVLEFDHQNINNRMYYYKCICECGTTTIVSQGELKSGGTISCGCLKSKLEREIRKWLLNHNIKFKTEISFKDLVTENNGHPRFDFQIYYDDDNYLLLEAQGEQHYKEWKGKEWFGKTERDLTDELKKDYCNTHNIQLEEILYNQNINKRLTEIFIHDNPVLSVNEKLTKV